MTDFQQVQRQFLAHLRNPGRQQLPVGFARQGVDVYVDLLYNKFNDSLTACFPVTHAILEGKPWQRLLKDFIAEHRCLSPYYRQIADEFVRYLQSERRETSDPPFLAELAHFEWTELVLSIAEAEPVMTEPLTDARLMDAPLAFAPVMRLLHYVWPVQHISPAHQPGEPPSFSTHIIGFRDAADHVQFIALNPATAGLVQRLQRQCSATQVLQELGKDLTPPELSSLLLFGKSILADLHRQGAIIGIQPH